VLVVRARMIDSWMAATRKTYAEEGKRVYYLSLEFLVGRLLRDAMSNLGLMDQVRTALAKFDVVLEDILPLEADAALGNGGLGRLAACFMESMASVGIPAYGYGIRYQNGLFRQELADGWQVELPEEWLAHGNPWEFERRESAYEVGFGGTVAAHPRPDGTMAHEWHPAEHVLAVAFDTPVVGWRGARVNTLRLWSAQPVDPMVLDRFNSGDHLGAVEESARAQIITRVLYPADSTPAGQELRLKQEFFFSSASLQDIFRRHLQQYGTLDNMADKMAIQLNDTHPAISIAEMMRLLVDVHFYDWAAAWDIARGVFSYTNHTLLPEALETWPVALIERLLPRQMQIIYSINAGLLVEAREAGKFGDGDIRALSLIDENGGRYVRMGQLAFVGSHAVNGVSSLHTSLMKKTVFRQLHRLYGKRISNKTNGVTPRRWLFQCNPGLTKLIGSRIGEGFKDDINELTKLNDHKKDAGFQEQFRAVKRDNKVQLSNMIGERVGLKVDPDALFDVQIKRVHEYKRQLLNILEAVAHYDTIRAHPETNWVPRVKIFAGKAAPGYWQAKLIIKLINDVARVVNGDPAVRGLLKIAFLPNYNVSAAEVIIPGADLSEQISTAGMEASGTGNMKLALNGALTIGTLDGANVEMVERVGAQNIEIFGLSVEQVEENRTKGHQPRAIIERSHNLREALDAVASGVFSSDDVGRYTELIGALYDHDWFMVAADFDAYHAAQRRLDGIWQDQAKWDEMTISNTANMGWFSSDRTILEYAREIWGVI